VKADTTSKPTSDNKEQPIKMVKRWEGTKG